MKRLPMVMIAALLVTAAIPSWADSADQWSKRAYGMGDQLLKIDYYSRAIQAWTPADGTGFKAVLYYNRGLANFRHPEKSMVAQAALALADMNQAIELDPAMADAYYMRAESLRFDDGANDRRLADYSKAIELKPSTALFYLRRGFLNGVMKRKDGERADYDKAIELKPDYAEAYELRAEGRQWMKTDLAGAEADFSKAVGFDPSNKDYLYNRAKFYEYQTSNYQGAVQDCSRLIQLDPSYSLYYRFRADARLKLKQFSPAIEDYSKFIQMEEDLRKADASYKPLTEQAYLQRSRCYEAVKDPDHALADLEVGIRAASTDQARGSAIIERAAFFTRQKKYEKALADYEMIIKLSDLKDYQRDSALAMRAYSFEQLGRFKEVETYRDAVIARADPKSPPLGMMWDRAQYFHRRGKAERVEQALTALAKVDAGGVYTQQALLMRGWLRFDQGKLKEAAGFMAKADDLKKGVVRVLLSRAVVDFALGRQDAAKAGWDEALKGFPGFLGYVETIATAELTPSSFASNVQEQKAILRLYEQWGRP